MERRGIESLPTEMLLAILHLALDNRNPEPKSYYCSITSARLVSRFWSSTIKFDSRFWTVVPRGASRWVIKRILDLSGSCPLIVKTSSPSIYDPTRFFELIGPHVNRCRRLELAFERSTIHQIHSIGKTPLPLLETLIVVAGADRLLIDKDDYMFLFKGTGDTRPPKVKHLEFRRFVPDLEGWKNLTSLVLVDDWDTEVSPEDIVMVLRGSPRLEDLHLELEEPGDEHDFEDDEDPIELTYLRRLVLHWGSYSTKLIPLLRLRRVTLRQLDVAFPADWYEPGDAFMGGTYSDNFDGCLRVIMYYLYTTHISLSDDGTLWTVSNQDYFSPDTPLSELDWSYKFKITCTSAEEHLEWLVKFLNQAPSYGRDLVITGLDDSAFFFNNFANPKWMAPFDPLVLNVRRVDASRICQDRGVLLALVGDEWYMRTMPKQLVVAVEYTRGLGAADLLKDIFDPVLSNGENWAHKDTCRPWDGIEMIILRLRCSDDDAPAVRGQEWDEHVDNLKREMCIERIYVHDEAVDGVFDPDRYAT